MAALPCFLAIDLGTSGPKVALVDLHGQVLAHSTQSTRLILTSDHGFEQDPQDWWRAVTAGIKATLAASPVPRKSITAIACTAQWSGTVPVDHNGRNLMNAIIWMDSRGAGALTDVTRGLVNMEGYGVSKLLPWIYKTGGAPGLAGKDSLAHILYLKKHRPAIYDATYKFLEPKDYLNLKLTGEFASSFDTMALHWITNNRNLANVHYDPYLMKLCRLDPGKFPPMAPATSVLANLRPDLAREFGLANDVKVIQCSPDVQTAAIGSGAVADYAAHLYLGTSSWLSCHMPYKRTGLLTKMVTLPSALPKRYLLANAQEAAGSCIGYLRNSLCGGLGAVTTPFTLAEVEELAQTSPPGSRGLLFTPWLAGERTPVENSSARGGFHNLSFQHRGQDFARAVYEGVAFNSCWLLQSVESFLGQTLPSLHIIGGGALSHLWCQLHADILERPIKQVADPRQANARGAAWIAAMGLGLLVADDIPALIKIAKEFEPQAKVAPFYQQQFREFLAIYRANKSIYKRLNHSPPLAVPGGFASSVTTPAPAMPIS